MIILENHEKIDLFNIFTFNNNNNNNNMMTELISFLQNTFIVGFMVLYYNTYKIINQQQETIDKLNLEITKLQHITQKNKKEIIGIRNDMTDYLDFKSYNYDDN